MDANRNTIVDYAAVSNWSADEDAPAPVRSSDARTYVRLAGVLVALMLAILLVALLAQPVSGS